MRGLEAGTNSVNAKVWPQLSCFPLEICFLHSNPQQVEKFHKVSAIRRAAVDRGGEWRQVAAAATAREAAGPSRALFIIGVLEDCGCDRVGCFTCPPSIAALFARSWGFVQRKLLFAGRLAALYKFCIVSAA